MRTRGPNRSTLVLAFFSDPKAATVAFRDAGRSGFPRAVAIRRGGDGRLIVENGGVSLRRAALGSALALIAAVVYFAFAPTDPLPPALRWGIAALVAIAGATASVLASYALPRVASGEALRRYGRWVSAGEAVVVVQTEAARAETVLELLRRVQEGHPSAFVLRTHRDQSPQAPVDRPRAERFSQDRLRVHAARLATTQVAVPATAKTHTLWARVRDLEQTLEAINQDLSDAAELDQSVSLPAEWLLDNAYILQRHVGDVQRNLSRTLYDVLPVLAAGTNLGEPRAYEVAQEFVTHADAEVHGEDVLDFLRAYQRVTPLAMGELWAMPLMLRLALLENVSSLAVRIRRQQYDFERADFWADRLLSASRRDPDHLLQMLAELAREHPEPSATFADRLISQLQGESLALDPIRAWLERKWSAPVRDVIQQGQRQDAADQVTIANAIGSLRRLSQLDWREVFEAASLVDEVLAADPAGVYASMDFETRDRYRHVVEEIATGTGAPELDVARAAIELARHSEEDGPRRHVGYFLLDDGRAELEARYRYVPSRSQRARRWVLAHPALTYLGSVAVSTGLVLAVAFSAVRPGPLDGLDLLALLSALILAAIIASELAVQLVNHVLTKLLLVRPLPKLSFEDGIPEEWSTLVVVPVLLHGEAGVRDDLAHLELRYLANREENLHFALLADYADASSQSMPDDAALLESAAQGIAALNARYGERFSLFYRERRWSESEQVWMCWERKRGKLEELNRWLMALRGEDDRSSGAQNDTLRHVGDPVRLRRVKLVITLDADTQLPHGVAHRLVGTLAHPLNRPRLSADGRTVSRGYTIIQPRVTTSLTSAVATRFSRVFTDPVGIDPYTLAISDLYQDLTGEGSYHGKGIYDVEAFHRVLDRRFPEAHLLSHDLLEGTHVRVGLASDVELLDQFPSSYLSYASRQHRWIRGDWQIAEWSTPWVPSPTGGFEPNPLSVMNRWKIFDNLRRSLVPLASVLLLVLGWLALPSAALVWSLLVALVLFFPSVLKLGAILVARPLSSMTSIGEWRDLGNTLLRGLISVALLPHQAAVSFDAIGRVWYRRFVSHKRMLEWVTSQVSDSRANGRERRLARQMGLASLTAVVLAGAIWLVDPAALTPAAPFLALWAASPAVVLWLNRSRDASGERELGRSDRAMLRRLARQTWRYFDEFVGPQSNWLPPDNYQEALNVGVAERTSPTNVGLWLLSALAAWDFGYLTADDLICRLTATTDTLDRLERFEGHLLNWYDTRSLLPLHPRYVSTVDSGNLLASIWTVSQGLEEVLSRPLIGPSALRGLSDALGLALVQGWSATELPPGTSVRRITALVGTLAELLDKPVHDLSTLVARLRAARNPSRELAHALGSDPDATPSRGREDGGPAGYWAAQLARQIESWLQVVDRYLPWVGLPSQDALDRAILGSRPALGRGTGPADAPSLRALAGGQAVLDDLPTADRPASDLAESIAAARRLAGEVVAQGDTLVARLNELAGQMRLAFLYDEERRLFTIGHNVEAGRFDPSYYDLLASEARLASFVAIARGEVPVEHWLALGRAYGTAGRRRVLFSWSGTMFEYLMPLLLMRSYEHTLLDDACREGVAWQIEYGSQRGVPWGISEAAFSAVDAHKVYQYQAFGVPGLGLKRNLEDDLVVAPYATALALAVDPQAAIRNLKQLDRLGMRGSYGYYESIDFTRRRLPEGRRSLIVYTYMVHHQGMTLLALDNALHGGPMQSRFLSNPEARAAEPLLYERIPSAPLVIRGTARGEVPARLPRAAPGDEVGSMPAPDAPIPWIQILGSERYSVMVTSAGAGYSRWRDLDLSRWRADTTLDSWGSFFYVQDVDAGVCWSATYQPRGQVSAYYGTRFSGDKAEFERRDLDVSTTTEVVVSLEDDVEVRRITLVNHSDRQRHLEVTSYVELALAPHAADRAHPAFGKLFVRTEALTEHGPLLAHRRRRHPHEPEAWAVHTVALPAAHDEAIRVTGFETDRGRFIGRGRSARNPLAVFSDLGNTAGAVLDPVFSLRCAARLAPGQRVQIAFVTGAADTREAAVTLVEKYSDPHAVERAFELSWSQTQLLRRQLRVTAEDTQRFQQLASSVLYPNARLRATEQQLRQNQHGQSRLWAYGISGDLPIVLVTIGDVRDLDLVREVLVAHTYWRLLGLKVDLVVLNEESGGYQQRLQEDLRRLIEANTQFTGVDQPGGVFLRSVEHVAVEDIALMHAAARVVLVASRGALVRQLSLRAEATPLPEPYRPTGGFGEEPSAPLPFMELPYFDGLGGFTPDGREYAIYLGPGTRTPAPWVNVMANPSFGSLVSESGQGFAWYGNSQSNRLLPWSNDPVADPAGDAIYIRDEDLGVYWTPTPRPIRELDAYRTRHGQGYTVFEHNSHAIEQELVTFVPLDDSGGLPVRVQRLRLRNASSRRRRLRVTLYAEWVLGVSREENQPHVVSNWDTDSRSLFARNAYNPDYGGRIAFASASPRPSSYTADRAEFLGRNGSPAHPAALGRAALGRRIGAGLDPCAALQVVLEVDPGQEGEVTFLLGQAQSTSEAQRIVARFRDPERVDQALRRTMDWWNRLLGALEVETPDLSVNFLLNRWLLYQTLSCRVWARTAFYQSGGAIGFRDQLQDCMALVYATPRVAREQILGAAAHQFVEGDVQHWWHPQSGAGVRTRISDDLLWLPYVTAHYVRVTGDESILDEAVPFLEGRELGKDEHELYFVPTNALEAASLLEHCRRAIARAGATGPHGLPLIGTGDWNDGLNLVGAEGRGESVWLAWFLIEVLDGFAQILERRGDSEEAAECWTRARRLAEAVESQAWDGDWYRRAYFDDGTPLGSKLNEEARIDSLPQSWAVISGAGDAERARRAMRAVEEHLIKDREKLVLLFTPPFDRSEPSPGYIQGYPPGVRENGGQYTHGALWVAMALARLGDGERAVRVLRLLNPVEHARTPEDAERYRVEPYVVAADVYALEGRVGQGGWTWYTGSSGWMYRVWIEEVLGFKLRGKTLALDPVLPPEWTGFRLRFWHGETTYEVAVENPDRVSRGIAWVAVDGERQHSPRFELVDDGGTHVVVVRLGVVTPSGLASPATQRRKG